MLIFIIISILLLNLCIDGYSLLSQTDGNNEGSVARDCMANERTFLAWMRTSLNCITLGIAIVKLLDPSTLVKVTGIFFIGLGLGTVMYLFIFLSFFTKQIKRIENNAN